MNVKIVETTAQVVLVGGGALQDKVLREVLRHAKVVVAADGGANPVLSAGRMPDAVFGDMDSLSDDVKTQLAPGVLRQVAEQESTDFDKCLRHIKAPLVIGYGFLGRRLDHQLAAMNVLVRRPETRCVLVGKYDVVCHCPPSFVLDLPIGSRFSLFPMRRVTARSEGLRWPLDGIPFAPGGVTGTSNEVSGPVRLEFEATGMLLILPAEHLDALVSSLENAPHWPVPA